MKYFGDMEANDISKVTVKPTRMHEEFLALLERGRQIKARRLKEGEEWLAERHLYH